MRVLLVGQFTGYHAENSIFKALRELGVEADIVNADDYYRISFINRVLNKFLREFHGAPFYVGVGAFNAAILRKSIAMRPDLILFIKPIFVTAATIGAIQRDLPRTALYSWNFDHVDYRKNFSTYFYETLPLFDIQISGNVSSTKSLPSYGAKKAITIPLTVPHDLSRGAPLTDEERMRWGSDIVFVGNYAKEMRSEYVERLCRDGYDIKVYGFGWEKLGRGSCLIKNGRVVAKLLGHEFMPKVFQASKIALAFVREHNDEETGTRTWEIPLFGCFMLHVRTRTATELFEEGREAEFFGSYDEMRSKIDHYLRDESLRATIAKAGERKMRTGGNFIIDNVRKILELYDSSRRN